MFSKGSYSATGFDQVPLTLCQTCLHAPDLGQILYHLAPPVPQSVVRVVVERSLKSPHAVLQVHLEQPQLDYGRRVLERQQIGEVVRVVGRPG